MRERKWLLAVLFFFWGGMAFAPETQAQPGAEAFHRFHVNEQGMACTDCHKTSEKSAPGQELSFSKKPYHPACTDCHDDDFGNDQTAGVICLTCHTGQDQDLTPYPTGNYTMAHFSHAVHVDPRGRVNKITKVRQDCIACHKGQPEEKMRAVLGGHPECAPCHAGEQPAKPELSKEGEGCLGCHSLEKIDRNLAEQRKGGGRSSVSSVTGRHAGVRTVAAHSSQHFASPWEEPFAPVAGRSGRAGIQLIAARSDQSISSLWDPFPNPANPKARSGEVLLAKATSPIEEFSLRDPSYWDILPVNHGHHVRNRDGSAIDCVTCHTPQLGKKDIGGSLSLPKMTECASCHENATLVRQEYRIENCQVCHKTTTRETRPLALDGISSSIAHTESFRRHHEEAAGAADNQCRFCHVETVNAGQDNCSGCHSAMRPRSHTVVRFEETTHGRLAAMDRKECATCHTSDYCNRCHNIPPRSHFPLAFFRQGSHRNLAMMNLRSCFVCHTFENTCMECHEQAAVGSGR
jgi:hypothetical protein